MTTEAFEQPPIYTINGTGPYPIQHEYLGVAEFVISVISGVELIELDPADYSIAPESGTSGDLTLSATAAATYDGLGLNIVRTTILEQGWVGLNGSREKGLEQQLDRLTQALQDTRQLGDQSLRVTSRVPGAPMTATEAERQGRAVAFSSDGKSLIAGPKADEITGAQGSATAAAASAAAAAASAAKAAQYDGPSIATFAALSGVTGAQVPVAGYLRVIASGMVYERAPDEAPDAHHDYSGGSGVKWYEAGPKFSSRARAAAAVARGLDNGAIINVGDYTYVVDPAATGHFSAFKDYGVDGARAAENLPDSLILAFNFRDQNQNRAIMSVSTDGRKFKTINNRVIFYGENYYNLGARDISATWYRGAWWLFYTGATVGTCDYRAYKGLSLGGDWDNYLGKLAATPVASNTTPVAGGVVPADTIWAPEPFIDDDGKLYQLISIRSGNDYVNSFGETVKHFRPFFAEVSNLNNLTNTGLTEMVGLGGTDSVIDVSVIRVGDTFHGAVSNENDKTIKLYTASALAGPWTYDQTISLAGQRLEAPCWLIFRGRDAAGALRTTYRIYVDNNRDAAGNIVGCPYFFEADAPDGAFGSPYRVYVESPVRHGTFINLAVGGDPQAIRDVAQFVTMFGKGARRNIADTEALVDGAQTIYPQNGQTYFLDGTGKVADVTILPGAADHFYLANFTQDQNTGIVVNPASNTPSGFIFGFGHDSDWQLMMKRRADGIYYPCSRVRKSAFKAYNTATPVPITSVPFMMPWDSVSFNLGGHFDPATGLYRPPKGRVRMYAQVTVSGADDEAANLAKILRDGSSLVSDKKTAYGTSTPREVVLQPNLLDATSDGTQDFGVSITANGATPKTVIGDIADSFFWGECF